MTTNRDIARAALHEAKDNAGFMADAGNKNYAAVMAAAGLGYAMLDVADAIRDLYPLISQCADAVRAAVPDGPLPWSHAHG